MFRNLVIVLNAPRSNFGSGYNPPGLMLVSREGVCYGLSRCTIPFYPCCRYNMSPFGIKTLWVSVGESLWGLLGCPGLMLKDSLCVGIGMLRASQLGLGPGWE